MSTYVPDTARSANAPYLCLLAMSLTLPAAPATNAGRLITLDPGHFHAGQHANEG